MTVASFIASQRTEHGFPTRSAAAGWVVSESWFYKWHEPAPDGPPGSAGRPSTRR